MNGVVPCVDGIINLVCSPSQIFDLESLTCVDTCPLNSVVVVKDQITSDFELLRYCRGKLLLLRTSGFEIFIDTTATDYLDLGTKRFPYKGLSPALVELFNYLPVE